MVHFFGLAFFVFDFIELGFMNELWLCLSEVAERD